MGGRKDSRRTRSGSKESAAQAVKRWFFTIAKDCAKCCERTIVAVISVSSRPSTDKPDVNGTSVRPPSARPPRDCDFKSGNHSASRFSSGLIDHPSRFGTELSYWHEPRSWPKAIGVMMKLDFERAVLTRARDVKRIFREFYFSGKFPPSYADEYKSSPRSARVTEGDEKFYSL